MNAYGIGDRVINHTGTGCGFDLSVYTDGEVGRIVSMGYAPSGVHTYFVTFTEENWNVWQFYEEELTLI